MDRKEVRRIDTGNNRKWYNPGWGQPALGRGATTPLLDFSNGDEGGGGRKGATIQYVPLTTLGRKTSLLLPTRNHREVVVGSKQLRFLFFLFFCPVGVPF